MAELEKLWSVAMGQEARKFRMKPVRIEAFRFAIDPEPWWWVEQTRTKIQVTQVYGRDDKPLAAQIETLKGLKDVYRGYWVIRDSNGEIQPYTPQAFKEIFDAEELR